LKPWVCINIPTLEERGEGSGSGIIGGSGGMSFWVIGVVGAIDALLWS